MTERKPPTRVAGKGKPKAPVKRTRKQSVTARASAEAAATTKRRGSVKPKTGWERGVRDMIILQMAADGATNEAISVADGRSITQIKRIRKVYEDEGLIGGKVLLDKDPVKIIEGMLDRAMMTWRMAADLALETTHDMGKIGALKVMIQADARTQELLQSINKLPRELGTLRHVIDIRQIAVVLLDVVDRLEKGEATPDEARTKLLEMVGYGSGRGPEPVEAEG